MDQAQLAERFQQMRTALGAAIYGFFVIFVIALLWGPIWGDGPISPEMADAAKNAAAENQFLNAGFFVDLALTGLIISGLGLLGIGLWDGGRLASAPVKPDAQQSHDKAPFYLPFILVLGLALYLWGLIVTLYPDALLANGDLLAYLMKSENAGLTEPLVAFLAAGIGSTIATFNAYLRHNCEHQNFNHVYIPWYFLRPLMGSLLGLVFYWLIKGGVLSVSPIDAEGKPLAFSLDKNNLAGLAALVGLFSRQAIQKLREIFHTVFVTRGNTPSEVAARAVNNLKKKLPDELRQKVEEELKKQKESQQADSESEPDAESQQHAEVQEEQEKPNADAGNK